MFEVWSTCFSCFITGREEKESLIADEMAMIAEPFSSRCLIINSIRDRPFARSPIRKSWPAGAERRSALTDTPVHMGTPGKA